MKKILFFALALVASLLVFNACNANKQNTPSDPQDSEKPANDSTATQDSTLVNKLVGTWFYSDGEEDTFHQEYTVTIDDKQNFDFTLKAIEVDKTVHYGYTEKGDYEIKGDTALLHFKELTWHHEWDPDNMELPRTEIFTYAIKGDTMHLNWLDDTYIRPTEFIKK